MVFFNKQIGILLYIIAAVLGLLGVALSFSGSECFGGKFIILSIAIALSTAIKLGHLQKW